MNNTINIDKHPNPIFYRNEFEILNGKWDFAFDYKNKGELKRYNHSFTKEYDILVPYCYLTKKSGINITKRCDNVWYHRTITINDLSKDVILHFEGSDYVTKLWVNSKFVGKKQGGYRRLSFDITEYLHVGENDITVKVEDDFSKSKPRGKQRVLPTNYACFYEETTGIYKTVWLEFVNKARVKDFTIVSSFKYRTIDMKLSFTEANKYLTINTYYKDKLIDSLENVKMDSKEFTYNFEVDELDFYPWDVKEPNLYDIEIKYGDDIVYTYTGIRDIYTVDNKVYLNDHELYQKLILDQGYHSDTDLTLDDDVIVNDIVTSMELGFNGARKHQKRENDRFYYEADRRGYLVWAEMPSHFLFNLKSRTRMKTEWSYIVKELRNHPSIINWVPFNESWGILKCHTSKIQQAFMNEIYHHTKELDPTRLCMTNDGWDHTLSDLLTIHLYTQSGEKLGKYIELAKKDDLHSFVKKHVMCKGYEIPNKPLLLTEFGGTTYKLSEANNWGYGHDVKSEEEFMNRMRELYSAIFNDKDLCGYCYTQLTDVRQEMNGLMTMDRIVKINKEEFRKIQNNE